MKMGANASLLGGAKKGEEEYERVREEAKVLCG